MAIISQVKNNGSVIDMDPISNKTLGSTTNPPSDEMIKDRNSWHQQLPAKVARKPKEGFKIATINVAL